MAYIQFVVGFLYYRNIEFMKKHFLSGFMIQITGRPYKTIKFPFIN